MQPPTSTSEPIFERFEPVRLVAFGLALAFFHLALYGVIASVVENVYLQMALAVTIALLAVPSIVISLTESDPFRTLRLFSLPPPQVAWLVLLTLALPLPVLALDAVNLRLVPLPESYEEWVSGLLPSTGREWIQALLVLGVLGPVGEEVVFRGLVQQAGRRILGGTRAALAVGLIFAAIHVLPSFLAGLTLLGVVLGICFERTGSLLAPVAVHVLYNIEVLVVQTLAQDLETPAALEGWSAGVLGAAGGAVVTIALWRLRPTRPW